MLGGIRAGVIGAMVASGSVDQSLLMALNFGGSFVIYLVVLITLAFTMGGAMQFSLRVARGEKPDFGVVFSGGRFFAPMLGATLLSGIAYWFGSLACFVPGIFLAAAWFAYSAFIVDKGMGAIEALKASWHATAPYRVSAIVFVLLAFLVNIAGVLACCVGQLLVSYPLLMISSAYLYLKMNGEQPRLPGA